MSMIARRGAILLATLVLVLTLPTGQGRSGNPAPVLTMDFTDYSSGSVMDWLKGKGFKSEQDMKDERKIILTSADHALVMEATTQSLGLLVKEENIVDYSRIRIEWGVLTFPPGASYERGVRSDSIMVYVFFGNQKVSSGSLFVPDSPYFIGLFPCDSDRIDYPYIGRYFKVGGRYVCTDRTKPGATVTTDFAIADAFQRYFERDAPLSISGIAIGIDTKSATADGTAKAFIRRIEILR
jgi:hypothetical protein